MSSILKGIIILSLSVSIGNADSNQSTQNEILYIDQIHKSISETILEWSNIIDARLSNWLDKNETNTTEIKNNSTIVETNITDVNDNETIPEANITDIEYNMTILETNLTVLEDNKSILKKNTTSVKANTNIVSTETRSIETDSAVTNNVISKETKIPENTLEEEVSTVDRFFQNEKYLNETDETFIRIRSESYFESKGSNDFGLNVRVQMPLSKTKKRFRIFVDDLTLDNANDILQDTSGTADIGIHYLASREKILSRYSIGFSGIDPFVKARFNMPIEINNWRIDPIQTFRYSTDNKLEEETNIYFDRKINKNSLLRIQLQRSTQEEYDGMNYALSVQYYRSTKKDTGFGFAQSFFGNTEYEYTTEKGVPHPKIKKYGGIHDYVTSATWRANIWRKWFYYEIRPSVSFHKQYDYEPNYRVRFFLDFYFGRHH